MSTIRLIIADDQELFAESLKQAIEVNTNEIEVVAVARDGEEVVDLVERIGCDVVLMDVRMPRMDGVQATRRIAASAPDVKIIMLTTFDDDDYILEAIGYGAKGYVLKNISPSTIISFINTVLEGGTVMSPEVATKLAHHRGPTRTVAWYQSLQVREREILEHICMGMDNAEISERMNLGHQTVKNYVSSIYAKMGVHNRIEAFRMATENGVYTTND